jgi:hypothetical protein
MPPEVMSALITGAGVAGIWIICIALRIFVPGWVDRQKDEQIAELKLAVKTERERADAAVEAAQTTNLLLAGLRRELER